MFGRPAPNSVEPSPDLVEPAPHQPEHSSKWANLGRNSLKIGRTSPDLVKHAPHCSSTPDIGPNRPQVWSSQPRSRPHQAHIGWNVARSSPRFGSIPEVGRPRPSVTPTKPKFRPKSAERGQMESSQLHCWRSVPLAEHPPTTQHKTSAEANYGRPRLKSMATHPALVAPPPSLSSRTDIGRAIHNFSWSHIDVGRPYSKVGHPPPPRLVEPTPTPAGRISVQRGAQPLRAAGGLRSAALGPAGMEQTDASAVKSAASCTRSLFRRESQLRSVHTPESAKAGSDASGGVLSHSLAAQ